MDIQSGDILLCEGNVVLDDYNLFRAVWRDPFENKWVVLPCDSDGHIAGAEWHYIDDDLVALGKYEPFSATSNGYRKPEYKLGETFNIYGSEWKITKFAYEPNGELRYSLKNLHDDDGELIMTQSQLNNTQIPF